MVETTAFLIDLGQDGFVLKAHGLWQGAKKRRQEMGIFPTRILMATDGAAHSDLAIEVAAELARETESELHLVCVGEFAPPSSADSFSERAMKRAESTVRRLLDERVGSIVAAGGVVSGGHARLGRPADELLVLAEEMRAGLLVVGSRRLGGLKRTFLGSVSDPVVRNAHCPVLVVRGTNARDPVFSFGRMLVVIDGSEKAELALRTAVDLARETGSELHVVTVGRSHRPNRKIPEYGRQLEESLLGMQGEDQAVLDRQVNGAAEAESIFAETHLRVGGRPDEEIVALSEELEVDLIVLGSRGLGGVRRALMGSVSDSVVRNARCPVLVARQAKETCRDGEKAEETSSFSTLTSPCLATAPNR